MYVQINEYLYNIFQGKVVPHHVAYMSNILSWVLPKKFLEVSVTAENRKKSNIYLGTLENNHSDFTTCAISFC